MVAHSISDKPLFQLFPGVSNVDVKPFNPEAYLFNNYWILMQVRDQSHNQKIGTIPLPYGGNSPCQT